jgi:hypothetical protein
MDVGACGGHSQKELAGFRGGLLVGEEEGDLQAYLPAVECCGQAVVGSDYAGCGDTLCSATEGVGQDELEFARLVSAVDGTEEAVVLEPDIGVSEEFREV